jgi:putative inorganic carbon (hco3(-)) transporter
MKSTPTVASPQGFVHPTPTGVWLRYVMVGAMYLFLASTYFSIAVNSLSLGLMALCFAGIMVSERRFLVRPTPLDYFFLAYVIAEILSTIFSYRAAQSFAFSKRILLIGIVYFFATWITTDQMAKRAVAVLLAAATIVACIGVGKLAFSPPEEVVRLGIFQFYMTTSELMMIALLLLLPFAVHPDTPRRIRAVAILALIPVGICLYATVTRGAYLAVAAGIIFIAVVRNKKLLIPLAVLILLVILFAPPYVESRIRSIVDLNHPENASRLMLWKTGLRIFADHPVVGIGDIDVHDLYVHYMDPGDPAVHGHMHNIAMQILVTLGSVGLIAVIAMFVTIVQTEWRIWKRVHTDWFRGSIVLGALAVFVGFQVNGLTEWSFGDQEIVILFWITLGLTLAVGELPPVQAPAGAAPASDVKRGES